MTGRLLGRAGHPRRIGWQRSGLPGPGCSARPERPLLQRLRLAAGYDRDVYYAAEGATAAFRNTYTYDRLQGYLEIDGPLSLVLRLTGGYDETADTWDRFRPRTARLTGATRCSPWAPACCGASVQSALLGVGALRTDRQSNDPPGGYERWHYGLQGFFRP